MSDIEKKHGVHCDYFGCNELITKEDQGANQMKFCKAHFDQLKSLWEAKPLDPAKLIGFWIKANGGAKRSAQKMI